MKNNFKIFLSAFIVFAFYCTGWTLPTDPGSHFFGYNISDRAQVIVEIRPDFSLVVWLKDPRISATPIQTGFSEALPIKDKIQLPEPDFYSKDVFDVVDERIDYSRHNNLIHNLKSDGILSINRISVDNQGKPTQKTMLIPLYSVLKNKQGESITFQFVPALTDRWYDRHYQILKTTDGHDVINVVDATTSGHSKSLTFFKLNDNAFYEIPEAWTDFSKIDGPIQFRRNGEHMFLEYNGRKLFKIGRRLSLSEVAELRTENTNLFRGLRFGTRDALIPDWNEIKFINDNKIDLGIAAWQPHQKLQVSKLGVMTYQDAPHLAPLFLDTVSEKNQPVNITKVANRLQITFENGNKVDYDLTTGQRLFETTTKKMCLLLFM